MKDKRETREEKRAYSHGRHEAIIFITNYHSLSHSHAKLEICSRIRIILKVLAKREREMVYFSNMFMHIIAR
jgi:hypothetical protein